jgi:hypothetical protein
MNLDYVLAQLRKERDAIEAAIVNLERLGRPADTPSNSAPSIPTNGFHRGLTEDETSSSH